MPFSQGARIGPYEVVAAIGAGGMGEVYRARDTNLQRDVALKVLPDAFATDHERRARFEREARVLAALNHPNIAQVYGVEGSEEVRALAMEMVPGVDLSQRIAQGPIDVDEALAIATQIAEGLEAAHGQGVIHRDLKPANIKLRPDGVVKILDFGLAKASQVDPVSAPSGSDLPTITTPFQMSRLGVILGTAAYMAPEQARGRAVDKRADIWAFGCVLFEMLTGARAFPGQDATDTIAAIVRADPDWAALPRETPASIRTLLQRTLAKDPRDRLPDIGAARLELKDAQSGAAIQSASMAPRRRAWLPWAIAASAILAAILALGYAISTPTRDTRVFRTVIVPPAPLPGAPALRFTISPDGQRLAFVAPDAAGNTVLWVRPLDAMTAQPLPDTINATAPFWSPDSRSIAFVSDGKLRRVSASGGAVLTICDASSSPPGTWNRGDVILISSGGGPVLQVSANGGTPTAATQPTPGIAEALQISPFFLPDQRRFLYTAARTGSRSVGVYVGSLDSKVVKPVIDASSNAAYANGHLLFLRQTTLMAQPFDPETLTLSGEAKPVATDVQTNPSTGTGAFSVSQTGVLVYQSGPSTGTQLTWRDRTGKVLGTVGSRTANRDLQLSPNEAFVSVTLPEGSEQVPDVWIFDLARGLRRRFTFGSGNYAAVWSPDGQRLAYASARDNLIGLYMKNASGVGGEELLLRDEDMKYPLGFTPDGAGLLYAVQVRAMSGNVMLLRLAGERKPIPLFSAKSTQLPAELSPDGRWLAFVSDETGRREVYVTSFPGVVGRWQISTTGGDHPRWRSDGKELFFLSGDKFMAMDVDGSGQSFDSGATRHLFDVRVPATQLGTRSPYAVSRDGKRFLFNMWDASTLTPISVVVNWPASLQ